MSNVCLNIQSTVDRKKTMFSQVMCLKVSRVKEYFFCCFKAAIHEEGAVQLKGKWQNGMCSNLHGKSTRHSKEAHAYKQ